MGTPKALLHVRGRTFLENILRTIAHAPIGHTVVVLGHHREVIERSLSISNVVFNADYEQGMTTSIQAGIRALPPIIRGALLFLVDHPIVDAQIIDLLIANLAPNRIVLPVFKGRRGHPVLFAKEILDEILALPPSSGANLVVRRDPSRIVEVEVDSAGVLIDIDTPEQFEELRREHGSEE